MALTPITATESTVTDPVPSVTYDRWYLMNLQIETHNPNTTTRLEARFRKAKKDETAPEGEQWEMAPRSDDTVAVLRVEDLFAAGDADPALTTLMDNVVQAITAMAAAENLL